MRDPASVRFIEPPDRGYHFGQPQRHVPPSLVIKEVMDPSRSSQMPIKSELRQKEWQKINKNSFSSEIARYKLIKTNLIEGKEDGKKVYIFSHLHCWKRPLGCNYLTTENKFIISKE